MIRYLLVLAALAFTCFTLDAPAYVSGWDDPVNVEETALAPDPTEIGLVLYSVPVVRHPRPSSSAPPILPDARSDHHVRVTWRGVQRRC